MVVFSNRSFLIELFANKKNSFNRPDGRFEATRLDSESQKLTLLPVSVICLLAHLRAFFNCYEDRYEKIISNDGFGLPQLDTAMG